MAKRLALGYAFASMVDAAMISGQFTEDSAAVLFLNLDTDIPKAKASNGSDNPTNTLKWEISNLSWIDEDSGLTYLEITSTLTAPILATDKITFHVEFTSSKHATLMTGSQLLRDGFECTLTKSITTNYWETAVKDLYVRGDAATATAVIDFNNSAEKGGQDWFVAA